MLFSVRKLAPIVSHSSAFSPKSGTAYTKEERIYFFIFIYTLLTISYAGFFAMSHMIFFSSIDIPILSTAQE